MSLVLSPLRSAIHWYQSRGKDFRSFLLPYIKTENVQVADRTRCDNKLATYGYATSSTKAFETITQWLKATDDDAEFWWYTLGSSLATLLAEAGYDADSQYGALLFFQNNVIDHLGPRPTATGEPVCWKSFMTDDFSPVEFSWSWGGSQAPPKIRYTTEAIGPVAGTRSDPFNQEETMKMSRDLRSALPHADWQLFDHICHDFGGSDLQNVECAEVKEDRSSPTSLCLGFEVHKANIALKAYCAPVKADTSGVSKLDVLSQTFRNLEGLELDLRSYVPFLDFMKDNAESLQLDTVGVAIDCVAPAKSRLKIYVRSAKTSFKSVQTILSMGGRLDPFTTETLRDLKKLWQLTLGLDESFPDSKELPSKLHQTAGVIYNFDIRDSDSLPKPKIYIPVKHYAPNDLVSMQGLCTYLKIKGEDGFADGYARAIGAMGSFCSWETGCGLQTFVSCAFEKERLALTSYISPQIYHKDRW